VRLLAEQLELSERRACRVIPVHRSSQRYRAKAEAAPGLKERLLELAAERRRFGYERLHLLLRREGWRVNHKRVLRRYRQEGLALRRRKRNGTRRGFGSRWRGRRRPTNTGRWILFATRWRTEG
jgi:hypothetical protein